MSCERFLRIAVLVPLHSVSSRIAIFHGIELVWLDIQTLATKCLVDSHMFEYLFVVNSLSSTVILLQILIKTHLA